MEKDKQNVLPGFTHTPKKELIRGHIKQARDHMIRARTYHSVSDATTAIGEVLAALQLIESMLEE